jgi:hypothetical protein
VQEVPERPGSNRPEPRDPSTGSTSRTLSSLVIPLGVVISLVGLVGDLVSHIASSAARANEQLIVLGSGNNPWNLVLLAGILVTAIGGIAWASRLRTESGALVGAVMVVLLVATVALAGWAGWRNAHTSLVAHAAAPGTNSLAERVAAAAAAGAARTATTQAGHAEHIHAAGAEGSSFFGEHSHGKPGPVTPAEARVLDRQLAAAKKATARYRDIDVARKDGYFQVTQFIPGLGLHMVNLHIPSNVFDPAHPQILLYWPRPSGKMVLAGVAYQFAHTSDTPPAGFAGGSDVWHYHTNLCFLPGGSVTISSADGCKLAHGFFQAQTAWLLHAWIWKTNPDGVFTEYNPNVT